VGIYDIISFNITNCFLNFFSACLLEGCRPTELGFPSSNTRCLMLSLRRLLFNLYWFMLMIFLRSDYDTTIVGECIWFKMDIKFFCDIVLF